MRTTTRLLVTLAAGCLLLVTLSCSGGSSDSIFGTADQAAALSASFGRDGEIPIEEGLALGADPRAIELDPCDPEAPTDAVSGKLLGSTMIGAFVRDSDLNPVVGVEVSFATSAGELGSMGQAVLTDEQGLATDTLTVDEDTSADVMITVTTANFEEVLIVPVALLEKQPVMLAMNPSELWPPNHELREVGADFDGLNCYPDATLVLVSVTSSEPDDDNGDGNTTDDIQGAEIGTDDTSLMLRAERSGGGEGRVYTVTYDVSLGEGETSTMSATVTVPHDQGH